MTSVYGSLDAISAKAKTVIGIKECYTATGSGVSDAGRPIPLSIDDGPVGVVWCNPTNLLEAGNAETIVFEVTLDIWVPASDIGAAFKLLAPFPDRIIAAYRNGISLGGQADRCLLSGWGRPAGAEWSGKPCLYWPFTFEISIFNFSGDDYTV